jgi:SAM-dependent methyltransferase
LEQASADGAADGGDVRTAAAQRHPLMERPVVGHRMGNASGVLFVARCLSSTDVANSSIVEFGSQGFGVRSLLEAWHPREYVGVDVAPGRGVDVVTDVTTAGDRFGANRFDLVVSTELLEHVQDWKAALRTMKAVCKPGGRVILTTRSRGFPYHGAPSDYWRFEQDDLRAAFSDFEILRLETDPLAPGVFIAAAKPHDFAEKDLSSLSVYSILEGQRTSAVESVRASTLRRWKFRLYGRAATMADRVLQASRRRTR